MTARKTLMRKAGCSVLSLVMVLLSIVSPMANAQSTTSLDLTPPVIKYEPVTSGKAGEAQLFVAEVLEDRSLLSVILYHRFSGDGPYASTEMLAENGGSMFSASVVTDLSDIRDIEYYIQAEDGDGNRTIKGFAFDPLVRQIRTENAEKLAATAAATSSAASESSSGGSRWMWGVLGLLVVVVAAGAAGSGGSNGGTTAVEPSTVVLDVEPL